MPMYQYLFHNFTSKKHSADYVMDKQKSISTYKSYMYDRLLKMFHYENLPETIPQHILEYYLLSNGQCFITEVNSQLFAFIGTVGGEPDVYYQPTKYIIANPGLRYNKELTIRNVDGTYTDSGVYCRNDKLEIGLHPLISRYAYMLAENLITLRTADVMLRVVALLSAPDDKTKQSAENFLRNIDSGKMGVVDENRFFDGIKMQSPPSNNGSYLTQFIELQQYLLGSFYNEIGLNSLFNMKREAINESEAALSEDTLLPLIDNMLESRKNFVERVNSLYDTNISVDYDSIWRQNVEETKLQLEAIKDDIVLSVDSTQPTEEPTIEPTEEPTSQPTEEPTSQPTEEPTIQPTQPSVAETSSPQPQINIQIVNNSGGELTSVDFEEGIEDSEGELSIPDEKEGDNDDG